MMNYNLDDMESLLHTCEADLNDLQNFRITLQTILENKDQLQAYYDTQYRKDYETA